MASLKKNDTGLRVLEILKALISSSMSSDEMMKLIEKKDNVENVYTKETFTKYFNTMELVGLRVAKDKKNNCYYLDTMPVEIELNQKDIMVLCLLEGYVSKLYNKYIDTNFSKAVEKLKRSFSKETKLLYETTKNNSDTNSQMEVLCNASLVTKFEKYCIDGQKLKIAYVNRSRRETELHTVEPKSLLYEKSAIYLCAYNPLLAQNQKLLLENIVEIEQLPQRSSNNSVVKNIVFELKAPLSKSYKLKNGERVINYTFENLIVSNSSEDKNILFRRLLRYGENCRVLHPKDVQVEFKELIKRILVNLECENHFYQNCK